MQMTNKFFDRFKKMSSNDKIVLKNVLGAFLVKGGALFVSLYTLPAYIEFFNNDIVLGLWYTILSLLNWILNFDLGIGNGLRNHLATSLSVDNKDDTKKYISSAYFSIGVIVLIASIVFPIVGKYINFNVVFNILESDVSPNSLYKSVVIVFVGVMIQFWLKLINNVLYSLQKSSINNFLVLCTNIIILIATLIIPSGDNDKNVLVMSIVHAIAVAVPLIIATIIVFTGQLKYAKPKLSCITKKHTLEVLSLGGVFFLVQIAYMLIMSTNEFLITRTSGNEYVVGYQAYYKLFSLGSTIFALALTPIWSVITKAKAENNNTWIEKTYKKFMLLALIFCVGEVFIVVIMRPLMNVWLGKDNVPVINIFTGLLFAILGCEMMVNSVLSSIANGLGKLKDQAICFFIGALLKIPLSYLLVKIMNSWNGVVLANVICMGIYCVVQPITIKKIMYAN